MAQALPAPDQWECGLEQGTWRALALDLHAAAAAAARVPADGCMPRESDLFYACGMLPGIPPTMLCYFNMRLLLVAALRRAASFVENGRTLLSDSQLIAGVKSSRTLGINLSTPTLREYFLARRTSLSFASKLSRVPGASVDSRAPLARVGAWSRSEPGVPDRTLLVVEERFEREVVLPFIEREPRGYLIALSADDDGPLDAEARLAHELLHARSFHEPHYLEATRAYWKERVEESDKCVFADALAGHYDTGDEALMADEFQAYMLMPNLVFPVLETLAARHRVLLQAHLRDAGC